MPLASGQCDCGEELDSDGYHLITCKTGGGPVISHNNIVSALSATTQRAATPVEKI